MKKMKAICRELNKVITATTDDKNIHNEAIWYDEEGKAYTMMYARTAKKHFFIRYPEHDKA